MVVVTSVGYLTIDGKRYPVPIGEFRRFSLPIELPQLKAKRAFSPFVDGEITAFDAGIKPDDLDDEGNWYYDALGMEPTGPDVATQKQVKAGKQLVALGSPPASSRTLVSFRGNLYSGRAGSGQVSQWTGAAWSTVKTLAAGNVSILAVLPNTAAGVTTWYLVAFDDANANWTYTTDGTTWVDATVAGNTGSGVWGAGAIGGQAYAIFDEGNGAGNPGLLCTLTITTGAAGGVAYLKHRYSRSGIVNIGNTLYYASADTATNGNEASLYSFSGSTQSEVFRLSDNYPVAIRALGSKTYWGMQNGGELHVLDGNELKLLKTFDTTDPLSALHTYGGFLWVGLLRSASANSRTRVYRYDSDKDVWHQPHAGTQTAIVQALASFAQRLVLGTANSVLEQSASSRITAAELELPNEVYGVPGTRKPFTAIALQHSALISAQTVQGRWKLDDGSEVTGGTNSDVGTTETLLPLPVETIGARLRPKWYITNGAAQDLTIYGARIRGLPPIGDKEIWSAAAELHRSDLKTGGVNASLNDFQDFANLAELRRTGRFFQVVDPFRLNGQPTAAMQAVFDPQTPLEPKIMPVANSSDHRIVVPLRLMQALGDVVGLLDPSFEQSAAGAVPNAAWASTGTGTSALVSTAVTAKRGSKVLAVIFNGVNASFGRQQTIAGLTLGRYYTIGGWVRRATSGGTVRIRVTDGITTWGDTLSAATDTDFIYTELVVLAGAASITIACIGESTPIGTCYFDGITLRE